MPLFLLAWQWLTRKKTIIRNLINVISIFQPWLSCQTCRSPFRSPAGRHWSDRKTQATWMQWTNKQLINSNHDCVETKILTMCWLERSHQCYLPPDLQGDVVSKTLGTCKWYMHMLQKSMMNWALGPADFKISSLGSLYILPSSELNSLIIEMFLALPSCGLAQLHLGMWWQENFETNTHPLSADVFSFWVSPSSRGPPGKKQ